VEAHIKIKQKKTFKLARWNIYFFKPPKGQTKHQRWGAQSQRNYWPDLNTRKKEEK